VNRIDERKRTTAVLSRILRIFLSMVQK